MVIRLYPDGSYNFVGAECGEPTFVENEDFMKIVSSKSLRSELAGTLSGDKNSLLISNLGVKVKGLYEKDNEQRSEIRSQSHRSYGFFAACV